jgi:hypothetical protein
MGSGFNTRFIGYSPGGIKLISTLAVSLCYSAHTDFKSHVKSSPADLLVPSVLLIPVRCLLCVLLTRLLFTVTAVTSQMELAGKLL